MDSLLHHPDDVARMHDALVRIGGFAADGSEGFHFVGDDGHPSECPGCWAWWGVYGTARPTQEQLDERRQRAHLDVEWVSEGELPVPPFVHHPDCTKSDPVADCACMANRHCRTCGWGCGAIPCACRPARKVSNGG